MPGCDYLSKRNCHPRDLFIHFDEDSHTYTLTKKDGSKYNFPRSVSGFVKSFFKHFDSKKVIGKNIAKWKTDPTSKYKKFLDAIEASFPGSTWEQQSYCISEAWKTNGERQSSLGTALHLAIEKILNQDTTDLDRTLFLLQTENPPDDSEAIHNDKENHDLFENFYKESILSHFTEETSCHFITIYKELISEDVFRLCPEDAISHIKKIIYYHEPGGCVFKLPKNRMNIPEKCVFPELEAWKRWKIKNKNFIPYRTEWSVYSEEHDIAGQIDAIFIDSETGEYILVDWKRVSNMEYESTSPFQNERFGKAPFNDIPDTNFGHYTLQVRLYEMILKKFYGIKISKKLLVQIHPLIPFPGFVEHVVDG